MPARKCLAVLVLAGIVLSPTPSRAGNPLPEGFVRLSDIAPEIAQNMRYGSSQNFTGRPVPGYVSPTCILAKPVAEALKRVQARLAAENLSLLVFDCYRPKRAVSAFMRWAQNRSEPETREEYYPRTARSDLVKKGYIAEVSTHSRGIAVDLTLIHRVQGGVTNHQPSRTTKSICTATSASKEAAELDMGTSWDCFDSLSHTGHPGITPEAKYNREILTRVMAAEGLQNYDKEWWHFSMPLKGFSEAHDFVVD